jgi:hypothetical protein
MAAKLAGSHDGAMAYRLHELRRNARYTVEEEQDAAWRGCAFVERNGATFSVYSIERLDEPVLTGYRTPDDALDAYLEWREETGAVR